MIFTWSCHRPRSGRAITDIRAMGGAPEAPESREGTAILEGRVPAGEIRDYASQLSAYTQGLGRLSLSLRGYEPCHNARQVIEAAATTRRRTWKTPRTPYFAATGRGIP